MAVDHNIIGPCAFSQELKNQLVETTAKANELVRWQERQNGSLGRMANELAEIRDDLNRARDERRTQINDLEIRQMKRAEEAKVGVDTKFDGYNTRIQTLLGGMVVSLILLAVNLILTLARG